MPEKALFAGKNGDIFRAVMNTIIPRGGPFEAGAADYDLLPRVEEIVRSYDPLIRRFFPLMLGYLQMSSLLHHGRKFTSLPQVTATRFLTRMEHSPFFYRRAMILVLKLVTMLAFYEIDEVAEQIGYFHGCHLKGGRSRDKSSAPKAAAKKKPGTAKKKSPPRKKAGKKR